MKGLDLLPPNASKEDWNEKRISVKLEAEKVEAVLVISYVGSHQEVNYEPGDYYYSPYGFVGRGIYRSYAMAYSPGYYTVNESYVVQSDLYDLKNANAEDKKSALVWMGQSSVYSPADISSGAIIYLDNLVDYLYKNNILK